MPTFYDRFVESAQRWPQNTALQIQRHDEVESYTYAQTREMAEAVGNWLSQQGLQAGTRVAILADNHPRWVGAYLGIIASGLTVVPLDTAYHADQVEKVLKDSGAQIIFTDVKHLATTQKAVQELGAKIVLTDPANLKTLKKEPGEPRWVGDLDAVFAAGQGSFRPVDSPTESVNHRLGSLSGCGFMRHSARASSSNNSSWRSYTCTTLVAIGLSRKMRKLCKFHSS